MPEKVIGTVGYAMSDDGIRWTKPVLGRFSGPTGFRRAPQEEWVDGVFFEPIGFSKDNNLGCPIALIQGFGWGNWLFSTPTVEAHNTKCQRNDESGEKERPSCDS